MKLYLDNEVLSFQPVGLTFGEDLFVNVFAQKNNKTLEETLGSRRYRKLEAKVKDKYPEYLDRKLGIFLSLLKNSGDRFYQEFLNKYGDSVYCEFYITDERVLNKKGLYIFLVGNKLMYIGRCKDSYKKRINQGYGRITPKNCYIDGQVTNCRINSLVGELKENVQLLVCIMANNERVEKTEKHLIEKYKPAWNIQRSLKH